MSGFFKRYQKAVIWVVVVSFFLGGVVIVTLNQAGVFDRMGDADPSARHIAFVNGEAILAETASRAASTILDQFLAHYRQMGRSTAELVSGARGALFLLDVRARGLRQTIQEVLLGQAAEERRIRVSRAEINESFTTQYNAILQNNNLTESELEEILAQQQRALSEFKDSLRAGVEAQLRNTKLREQIIGVIDPTDEQLAEFLEANISNYERPESIRASHILVADEAAAQDIHQQLLAGADFSELAGLHSQDAGNRDQGGDLNWFERGRMVPEFEQAAFALEVGEISAPVQTQFGYHIIHLTDRRPAFVPTLEDFREIIRTDYVTEQESTRFTEWFDALYAAADIEITDPLLNAFFLQGEDLDLAIAEYERLLAANEVGDPYFQYFIGRAYESRALELARERLSLEALEEPSTEDLTRIEELRARGQEYENRALEHYLDALKEVAVEADESFVNRILLLDPNSSDARFVLATLYADRGDVINAEIQYAEIISLSPDYIRAFIASGDLAFMLGQARKAIRRFEDALALDPPEAGIRAGILVRLSKAYLEVGELADAESHIEQLIEQDPGNAEITILQGDLAAAQLAIAIDERDLLEAIAEPTSEQDLQLAKVQSRITELEAAAIGYFETSIERLGTLLDLHLKLGQVYLVAGRMEDAESEFRMILARSPHRIEAFVGLAEALIAQQDIEGALENLYSGFSRSFDDVERAQIAGRILEFAPDDVLMRFQYAQLLARQFKWSSAIIQYAAVIAADPTQVEAYLAIATAYRARREDATALEYLRRGLYFATFDAQREDLYGALIETMQTLAGVGQPLSTEGLDARINLAKMFLGQARLARALEQLNLVQTDDPHYRLDEVNALIVQAGGTVRLPVVEDVEEAPPADETLPISDPTPTEALPESETPPADEAPAEEAVQDTVTDEQQP